MRRTLTLAVIAVAAFVAMTAAMLFVSDLLT